MRFAALPVVCFLFGLSVAVLSDCNHIDLPIYCSSRNSSTGLTEVQCSGMQVDLGFLTRLSEDEKQCIEILRAERTAIKTLKSYQFSGLDKLKSLALNYNDRLEVIEQHAFDRLPQLERLEMNGNNLRHLPLRFISGLSNLTVLHLIQSNVMQFPDLTGPKMLSEINLRGNLFTTINSSSFNPISEVEDWVEFNLSGNPLVCDCKLRWIKSWLSSHPVAMLAFTAACSGPTEKTRNQPVNLLREEDFNCDGTVPGQPFCPDGVPKVTAEGEYCLRTNGVQDGVLSLACAHGLKCSVVPLRSNEALFRHNASRDDWLVVDLSACQYQDEKTSRLQCLSQNEINQANAEAFVRDVVDATSDLNLNFKAIDFAVSSLEGLLANESLHLSIVVVDSVFVTVGRLMAMVELPTCDSCSNRLISLLAGLAGHQLVLDGRTPTLTIDNHQLLYELFAVWLRPSIKSFAVNFSLDEVLSSGSGAYSGNVLSPSDSAYVLLYKDPALFRHGRLADDGSSCRDDGCRNQLLPQEGKEVNSVVVAAVGLGSATLDEAINESVFAFDQREDGVDPFCVSWNYSANGVGGWSCDACKLTSWKNNTVTCHCETSSPTGVLMTLCSNSTSACDCRYVKRSTQAMIAVIGSSTALGVVILAILLLSTTWIIRKRVSRHFKVHVHVLIALFMVLVSYLVAIFPISNGGISSIACRAVASVLHCSLLAAVLWLNVEAFTHLNGSALKKQGDDRCFLLNSTLLCWGIPLVLIAAVNVVQVLVSNAECELYGATVQVLDTDLTNGEEEAQICWMRNIYVFTGIFAGPVFLLIFVNLIVYGVVLSRPKQTSGGRLNAALALSVNILFAVTWTFGMITLSDHKLFSNAVCAAFAVFYYVFAALHVVTVVVVLMHYYVLNDDVWRSCRREQEQEKDKDDAVFADVVSDTMVYENKMLESKKKKEKTSKKKKEKRLSTTGFTKGAENIPLEELVGRMPFEMNMNIGGVAAPVRKSFATSMTETILRIDGRSLSELDSTKTEADDSSKSDEEEETETETEMDEDEDENEGATEEALTKNTKEESGLVESGWASASSDARDESESSPEGAKRFEAKEDEKVEVALMTTMVTTTQVEEASFKATATDSMAAKTNEGATSTPDIKVRVVDSGRRAKKISVPDPLIRQLRELDEVMTTSHASLDKLEEETGLTSPLQSPSRPAYSPPPGPTPYARSLSPVAENEGYSPIDEDSLSRIRSQRGDRSLRKILVPKATPTGAAPPVAFLAENRRTLQRVRRSDGTVIITEVRQPRRMANPGDRRYPGRPIPYSEMYGGVRRPKITYMAPPPPRFLHRPPPPRVLHRPPPQHVYYENRYGTRPLYPMQRNDRYPEGHFPDGGRPPPIRARPNDYEVYGYRPRPRQRPDYYEADPETGKVVEYRYVNDPMEVGGDMYPADGRRGVFPRRRERSHSSDPKPPKEGSMNRLMFFSGGDSNAPSTAGDDQASSVDFDVWYQG